jgi:hypothetical protein
MKITLVCLGCYNSLAELPAGTSEAQALALADYMMDLGGHCPGQYAIVPFANGHPLPWEWSDGPDRTDPGYWKDNF